VLENKGATGVAKIALRNKEQLCALRPKDGALVLETLHYPDEIREHESEPPHVTVNERELTMAGSLVDALSEPFDPSKYRDDYREAVLELIRNKAEGREVVTPEGTSEPGEVKDLMAALRASVEAARKGGSGAVAPARREKEAERRTPARRTKSAPAARTSSAKSKAATKSGSKRAA
jgi:DNA end-binding protein Ku